MFSAAKERHAAEPDFGSWSFKPHKQLTADKASAGKKRKALELRVASDPCHQAIDLEGARRGACQGSGVRKCGTIAEVNHEATVDLALGSGTGSFPFWYHSAK